MALIVDPFRMRKRFPVRKPIGPGGGDGYYSGGGAPAYEPEYQAYLDRATTLGYTLPEVRLQAIHNQAIKSLKQAGLFSKLETLRFYCNDNNQIATINVADPTNKQNLLINSPSFTKNIGFTGNASTMYINENWVLSSGVKYLQNDAHIFVYIKVKGDSTTGIATGASVTNPLRLSQINTRGKFARVNSSAAGDADSIDDEGDNTSYLVSRLDNTTEKVYQNGQLKDTNTLPSGSRSNLAPFNLARNFNGSPDFYTNDTIACVGYGGGLTDNEALQMSNIIHTMVQAAALL
jgi:hypothetical protein